MAPRTNVTTSTNGLTGIFGVERCRSIDLDWPCLMPCLALRGHRELSRDVFGQ